jgi:hypothetical protein
LGKGYYGSPTSSDKALIPFPTLKMGPGDSARSHTADEYVYINEIKEGIVTYIQLLESNYLQHEQALAKKWKYSCFGRTIYNWQGSCDGYDLAAHDVMGSIAHTTMLSEVGLLTPE